jgi:hypothetical protein
VRHGLEPDGGPVAVASCCMTEVDCGGGLKCLSGEDPCPSSSVHDDPWISGDIRPSLFRGERQFLERLGRLIQQVASRRPTRRQLIERFRRLQTRYADSRLQMTVESDGDGAWYDWLVRLSTGSVLRASLCTNAARRAPVLALGVLPTQVVDGSPAHRRLAVE